MRIRVEHRPPNGEWHSIGLPIGASDRWSAGSGVALVDCRQVTVQFGWQEDLPGVWVGAAEIRVHRAGRAPENVATERTLIADLRTGPFELDSPNGRWRWSLDEELSE